MGSKSAKRLLHPHDEYHHKMKWRGRTRHPRSKSIPRRSHISRKRSHSLNAENSLPKPIKTPPKRRSSLQSLHIATKSFFSKATGGARLFANKDRNRNKHSKTPTPPRNRGKGGLKNHKNGWYPSKETQAVIPLQNGRGNRKITFNKPKNARVIPTTMIGRQNSLSTSISSETRKMIPSFINDSPKHSASMPDIDRVP